MENSRAVSESFCGTEKAGHGVTELGSQLSHSSAMSCAFATLLLPVLFLAQAYPKVGSRQIALPCYPVGALCLKRAGNRLESCEKCMLYGEFRCGWLAGPRRGLVR